MLTIILLWMTISALPAQAIIPKTGDFFVVNSAQVIHVDAVTGTTTTVACQSNHSCTPFGTGPGWGDNAYATELGPDGHLYVLGGIIGQTLITRIDLATGDREAVTAFSSNDVGPGSKLSIYPAPNYFPTSVASLGGWGAVLLVVGILVGVQLRIRNTALNSPG